MYSSIDLSKYIVNKCTEDGHPISNLQLQKILYYIQKAFLKRNELAFPDEIEAWVFGPVVPAVYYHFCAAGAMPLRVFKYDNPLHLIGVDKQEIDDIVESKRLLKPWDLVEETHKKGGAWDKTYNNGAGDHHVIPTSLIREVG